MTTKDTLLISAYTVTPAKTSQPAQKEHAQTEKAARDDDKEKAARDVDGRK